MQIQAYDVPRLSRSLDFLNIMSYDWRGYWDGKYVIFLWRSVNQINLPQDWSPLSTACKLTRREPGVQHCK